MVGYILKMCRHEETTFTFLLYHIASVTSINDIFPGKSKSLCLSMAYTIKKHDLLGLVVPTQLFYTQNSPRLGRLTPMQLRSGRR